MKKILFYLLFVFMCIELSGQVLFRLVLHASPYMWGHRNYQKPVLYLTDHPYLPYYPQKGGSGEIEFNSFGHRGKEPDSPKTRIRIVTYGGSTTFDGVHPWGLTWPGQLQTMLGEEHFEVINSALNGGTTADTLVKLALIDSSLKPDLILVYHGTNDLEASFARGFKTDYSHRRRSIGRSSYPVFDRIPEWFDASAIFVALRFLCVGQRGDLWSLYTRPGSQYDFKNGPYGLETFRRNLMEVDALGSEAGAVVILGTFQYYKTWANDFYGLDFADAWERGIQEENSIIRQLADSEPNIFLADIQQGFTPDSTTHTDFVHLTELGNEHIARTFYEIIMKITTEKSL